MKTVKVTVKREQIEKSLGERFPIRRVSTRGVGLFSSVTQAEYLCPNEFTLELPTEQIEEQIFVFSKSKRKRFKLVGPEGGLMLAAGFAHSNLRWIKEIELEEVE